MNRAAGIMNRQAREIEKRSAQMANRLNGIGRQAAEGLILPFTGIAAALSAHEVAAYADAWTEAGNKIRAAATSTGVQVRSLDDLKDGANAARTDLESYVELYARLIRAASGVAKSEQEIAAATQITAQAFKAGGASASEQAAGILQLGQALGSGVLQGDELRSLRENAPILAQAIADEFKVTIAGLKDLGAEGKLTSDKVFQAILNAQSKVEAQFKATNTTIRDAMTAVNNEFTAYIGNADTSAGASRALANSLLYVATNFDTVGDAVVLLATLIAGSLTGRAIAGLITTLPVAVTSLGALLTALRAGAPIAATFTAALGPIGLLAGAAAAALLLLTSRQDDANTATDDHRKAVVELQDAFAAAQRGSDAAKKRYAELATQHLASAQAAVTHAEAELKAREAVQQAGASTMPAFGEAGLLAPSAQTTVDQNVIDAQAKLAKLREELADLQNKIANPEKELVTGDGYGKAAATAGDTKVGRRTAGDRFREDIQSVRDRTQALAEEQAMMGQSIAAQESRRVALDLEQRALADLREEARRKGETDLANINLAPDQVAAIRQVADAYGQQAQALYKAQEAFADANDLARGFADDLTSGLLNGASAAESLANALDNVADKLLDMALDSLFDPSGGGFLANLLKGFGFSKGGAVGFAGGGYTGSGGKYQPAGVVHRGEYVFDQGAVRAAGGPAVLDAMRRGLKGYATGGLVGQAPRLPSLSGTGGGASGGIINFAPVTNIDATGSQVTKQDIDGMLKQRDRVLLAAVKTALPGMYRDSLKRGQIR